MVLFNAGRVDMRKNFYGAGFTLAEMLLVLFVVSIIAISTMPLVAKKLKVMKSSLGHGRYECYWYGDDLKERLYKNNKLIFDNVVSSCSFKPTEMAPKANYYIIQAIGGGGGGAYSGENSDRQEVTKTGAVTVPLKGTVSAPEDAPAWLEDAFNDLGLTLSMTVYGGGGGGGAGSGVYTSLAPDPLLCSPGSWNNVPWPGPCNWALTQKSGGDGGKGSSCTIEKPLTLGLNISSSSGSGGFGATNGYSSGLNGGNGQLTIGETTCTATGGEGGTSASTNTEQTQAYPGIDGADGTPTDASILGGVGGVGYTASTTVPVYTSVAGTNGDSLSTLTSHSSIPYEFNNVSKRLSYAEGGKAGKYESMFFVKLNNLAITPGRGGAGGLNATSYQGASGTDTTVGTIIRAKGGAGGTIQSSTAFLEFYKIMDQGTSYLSTILSNLVFEYNTSDYILKVNGLAGEAGGFEALRSSSESQGIQSNTFGAGGAGGGSETCIGYNVIRELNGTNLTEVTYGNSSCVSDNNTYFPGSAGEDGAVVIIW